MQKHLLPDITAAGLRGATAARAGRRGLGPARREERNGIQLQGQVAVIAGMGRLIEADDVAKAALSLASELAAMISGHALEVDGGRAI